MKPSDCILFSGGAPGTESHFGAYAERHGVEEVNFTFDGHKIERQRGVRVLNHEELLAGDVSLEYLSRLLHRRYSEGPTLRKILQTLWYQVNNGQEMYVFDQDRDSWFRWTGSSWAPATGATAPVITHARSRAVGSVITASRRSRLCDLYE